MDRRLPNDGLGLVLVRQELVAQDIALTLLDRYGPAPIHMPHSIAEALECFAAASRVHAAVLELGPAEIEGSDLEREITSRGGRIVLFGKLAEAGAAGSRWPVLHRPFTDSTLLAILDQGPQQAD